MHVVDLAGLVMYVGDDPYGEVVVATREFAVPYDGYELVVLD